MFGRNNAEGGKEKKDEEGKERPVDKDAIHVVLAAGSVDSTTSGCLLRRNGKDVQAAFWSRNHFEQVGQSWDCSQVESEPEERDAVDCPMDDEMMRRWE